MKRLSLKRAIETECLWCMNGRTAACRDYACPLKNGKLTPRQRIREYCLRYVPEQGREGVKRCTGEVLDPDIFAACTLFV